MKILILDKTDKIAREILEKNGFDVDEKPAQTEEELIKIIPDYDALIVRSETKATKKVIEAGNKLKIIARAGVGIDNVDVASATEKGIVVMNAPFGNINAAAEHTLTLMMMLAKHVIHSNKKLKEGSWERKLFTGIELKGKVLGIVGLGKVGQIVARVANALQMKVIAYDPFADEKKAKEFGAEKVELDYLIKNSDFITVHVPLTNETKNLIDTKQFEIMKKNIRILNVARGGIINENALLEALENGKVAGAGIDVWNEEPPLNRKLVEHEKVIATPHLGASTHEAQTNVAVDVAEQIVFAFKEGKIVNAVNKLEKIRE